MQRFLRDFSFTSKTASVTEQELYLCIIIDKNFASLRDEVALL
ncbi:MAG: hypothetical protein Sw2LagTSB_35190 [Shewanella algae]